MTRLLSLNAGQPHNPCKDTDQAPVGTGWCVVAEPHSPLLPNRRHSFTDPIRYVNVTLVIPSDGVVFPMQGEAKIGVEHPGCPELADLCLDVDAFYCPRCRWSGRITAAWAVEQIEAATYCENRACCSERGHEGACDERAAL